MATTFTKLYLIVLTVELTLKIPSNIPCNNIMDGLQKEAIDITLRENELRNDNIECAIPKLGMDILK